MKILIIDDSKIIRNLIATHLAQNGNYQVAFAKDRKRATELVSMLQPDLVTLDINLSQNGREGFVILEKIKRDHPTVKVIMVSSEAKKADGLQALRLGADDYLLKPFSAKELLERVEFLTKAA